MLCWMNNNRTLPIQWKWVWLGLAIHCLNNLIELNYGNEMRTCMCVQVSNCESGKQIYMGTILRLIDFICVCVTACVTKIVVYQILIWTNGHIWGSNARHHHLAWQQVFATTTRKSKIYIGHDSCITCIYVSIYISYVLVRRILVLMEVISLKCYAICSMT